MLLIKADDLLPRYGAVGVVWYGVDCSGGGPVLVLVFRTTCSELGCCVRTCVL